MLASVETVIKINLFTNGPRDGRLNFYVKKCGCTRYFGNQLTNISTFAEKSRTSRMDGKVFSGSRRTAQTEPVGRCNCASTRDNFSHSSEICQEAWPFVCATFIMEMSRNYSSIVSVISCVSSRSLRSIWDGARALVLSHHLHKVPYSISVTRNMDRVRWFTVKDGARVKRVA